MSPSFKNTQKQTVAEAKGEIGTQTLHIFTLFSCKLIEKLDKEDLKVCRRFEEFSELPQPN